MPNRDFRRRHPGILFKRDIKLEIYPLRDRKTGGLPTIDKLAVSEENKTKMRRFFGYRTN